MSRVARRSPILLPSPTNPGVFGLDLTAGCLHGCPYCHIQGSPRFPGADKVLYDPFSADNLMQYLGSAKELPKQVVVSPTSDPLPAVREVRREAVRVVTMLLQRGIDVLVMTRGSVPRSLIAVMAKYREHARLEVGITTLERKLSRILEPRAASPVARLRGVERVVSAGVSCVIRLEPLIAGLTDTRENIEPLFDELARRGAQRIVAHYLFLQKAMIAPLQEALSPLGWSERVVDAYEGGPVFSLGSVGPTKHLPTEARREGLAKVMAWGAERGLRVETGATQNPDFPRPDLPFGTFRGRRSAIPVR